MDARIEEMYKRKSKLNPNSKTRSFIRLKTNYGKILFLMGVSLLLFAGLAVAKLLTAREGLDDIERYVWEFTYLAEEAAAPIKIFHNYKLLLAHTYRGNNPTRDELDDLRTRINQLDLSIEFAIPLEQQAGLGISQEHIDHMRQVFVGDLCTTQSFSAVECHSLLDGMLTRGYLTLRYNAYVYLLNHLFQYETVYESNPSNLAQLSQELLNEKDLKDYNLAWSQIQVEFDTWVNGTFVDATEKKNKTYRELNIFLILLCLCLGADLISWRYSYRHLIGSLHKLHRLFEILPIDLIKENRNIRSYFEKYFKIEKK